MNAMVRPASTDAFPLLDDIIVLTDAAMCARVPEKVVPVLVDTLRGLLAGELGEFPAQLLATSQDGYARRELYHSPRHDYRIFALAWAPGQGSPIHDHADTWGIEAVLQGELEVQDFRTLREYDALAELQQSDRHRLVSGDVIGLLPPHDLHACRNAQAEQVTLSLHIYGRNLERVRSYVPLGGRLYRQEPVHLSTVA